MQFIMDDLLHCPAEKKYPKYPFISPLQWPNPLTLQRPLLCPMLLTSLTVPEKQKEKSKEKLFLLNTIFMSLRSPRKRTE